jgi:type II secretory pathway component PulJ
LYTSAVTQATSGETVLARAIVAAEGDLNQASTEITHENPYNPVKALFLFERREPFTSDDGL